MYRLVNRTLNLEELALTFNILGFTTPANVSEQEYMYRLICGYN